MSILTLDLPDYLVDDIKKISSNINRSNSDIIKELIIEFVSEYQDAEIALERLNNPKIETFTFEEIEEELGI